MDIQSFLQQCGGKWVSQRTVHNLTQQDNSSSRSDLWVDLLAANAAEVVHLCEQAGLDPKQIYLGLNIRWNELADPFSGKKATQSGATLLAILPEAEGAPTGQIIRQVEGEQTIAVGSFRLGTDDALTFVIPTGDITTEERLWFASENLRMRSSIVKQADAVHLTTFCSEIRMGVPTPPDAAAATATSSGT